MALPWKDLMASGVLSAASGAPFDVTTGTDDNLDGVTSDRPPGLGRNTGASTSLSLVNSLRAADGLPPVERLSEPSFFQVDLRVFKPFLFGHGNGNGEAFLQVFNLLDRLNSGPIEGRANARDFGRPLGQIRPPRTVEIGLRIGF